MKKTKFYVSNQKIAEAYGIPNLFETCDDEEKKSNEMCIEVCLWIKAHDNTLPNILSLDPKERVYADWIKKQRQISKRVDTCDLLTIGQASKKLGIAVNTLRRWEKNGLIVPERTQGKHRRYNEVSLCDIVDSL